MTNGTTPSHDTGFHIARPGQILSDRIEDYPEGIVVPIDKPYLWTSADVVRKIKFRAQRHFHKKNLKVGHAGTLDPLATGVLLVCIGKATKLAEKLQASDKEYIAGITFGATTPSYDLEKEIDREYPFSHIDGQAVRDALSAFIGEQEQVAPLFSAKSVDGTRAYEIARKLMRKGNSASVALAREAGIKSSIINIYDLELLDFGQLPAGDGCPSPEECPSDVAADTYSAGTSAPQSRPRPISAKRHGKPFPVATIRIRCSKGTYVRAFARDLGESLGSGAHLSSLVRSRSGQFGLETALGMDAAAAIFSDAR